jgi:hypothetical protein
MTKKELWNICHANGISPLIYKWSFFQEQPDGWIKKKLSPIYEDIDSFIKGRNVWYIYLEDSVLASRIGAAFFKAAVLSGWSKVRYTTIENIAGYQMERWYENGDVYTNIKQGIFDDRCIELLKDVKAKNFTDNGVQTLERK